MSWTQLADEKDLHGLRTSLGIGLQPLFQIQLLAFVLFYMISKLTECVG